MFSRFRVETCEPRRLFAAPVLDSIPAYTVPVGKTIQIPVTSASNAGEVSYSVRDNSADVAGAFHLRTNTFIQVDVAGYAQPMVFQLFDDTTPETVRRIKGLINAKVYDGTSFYRVINDFVIQGGKANGGLPGLNFDDEFNVNTTFTGSGQLAMSNNRKDGNGSDFFVTEGPKRLLDFNHTLFGQLVRGEATREAISNVPTGGTQTPTSPVTITRVRVIRNTTDAVLVVSAKAAGTYTVKVTATNADGSTSRSFAVTAAADIINDPPILVNPQPVYYTTPGKAVAITLDSIDPEGNAANFFDAYFVFSNGANASVGGLNGRTLTITPTQAGVIVVRVGVAGTATDRTRGSTPITSGRFDIFDTQTIRIAVGDLPISAAAGDFDASSGTATGEIQVGSFRDSDAAGAASNFSATIEWGDGTSSLGTIRKSRNGRFAVYGNKVYGPKVSGSLPITLTVFGNNGAMARANGVATVRAAAELAGGTLTLNGTSGDDRISVGRKGRNYVVTVNRKNFSFATGTVSLIQAFGLAGSDAISLSSQVYAGTYLDGGDGNDAISGGAGNDLINAGAGADTVITGEGTNRVGGGDGNDTITGGSGRDRLFGGAGNDSLQGGSGRDIVSGDEGNDTVVGNASSDTLYGGIGNDILNGSGGADLVDGGAGVDTARDDELDTFIAVETKVA